MYCDAHMRDNNYKLTSFATTAFLVLPRAFGNEVDVVQQCTAINLCTWHVSLHLMHQHMLL
jgi:hypothetical protein